MLKKGCLALFVIFLLCAYFSPARGADRGGINSGETRAGIDITAPSYLDTWTFSGNAGDRVILSAVTTSGALDTHVVLYPPGGGPAEAATACPWGACGDQLDHQLQQTGLYTIVVEDSFLSNSGTYNISFLKIPGAVSSPGDPDGGAIASGESLGGNINTASDMDAFQFWGPAGARVIINVVTTSGDLDTHIVLYPPGGGPAEAATACPYGACGDQLDHQLQQTGLYTVVVEDSFLNKSGEYAISFLKIPGAVSSPGDPDGGAIASGETLGGNINTASDTDAFQFYGNAGDRVIASAVTTSGELDTHIVLYPPGGDSAEAATACPYGACGDQLDHQLQQTGLYTVVVEDAFMTRAGLYNVSLTKIPSTPRPGLYNPSPADGATLTDLSGSFGWDPVAGATGYDLYFGQNVTMPLTKMGDNLSSASMPLPPMEAGKTYYWLVVAHTPGGDVIGPYWWFRVSPDAITSGGWFDDFESYAAGLFPSPNWTYSGNSDILVDNTLSFSGTQSARLYGIVGSCWAAHLHRSLNVSPPFTVEFYAYNGSESLSGCHPLRAILQLHTGASWTTPTRALVYFDGDGNIRGSTLTDLSPGTALGAYSSGEWIKVKVAYRVVDASTVRLNYWINDEFIDSELLPSTSYEDQLVVVSLGSGEGTAWFDDVRVSPGEATRPSAAGVFRSGTWFLDMNGNGIWDGQPTDRKLRFGGLAQDIPVIGDWDGTGSTRVGIYRSGTWFLDLNGNGIWDGQPTDRKLHFGGFAQDIPVTGDWDGTGTTRVGIYRDGTWFLDLNGNGIWDGQPTDRKLHFGGFAQDIPIIGDWDGTGSTRVGIYRDGTWFLDINGNGAWDGQPTDRKLRFGGLAGDIPITGGW